MYWTNFKEIFSCRLKQILFSKEDRDYKFEKITRAKAEALRLYPNRMLLDFGIAEPDDMAFKEIREALKKEVDKKENRIYADNGIESFKIAAASYMKRLFSVELDYQSEINHTIGMKCGLAYFPKILIEPGDYALIPNPCYSVLKDQVEWLGGKIYSLNLKKENQYLPRLDNIPSDILKLSKVIYINYPNNPTSAVASKSFYEELVHFAKENRVIVVQDAAYAALSYDGSYLSFLQVEGAKEVGVEFHSLSKSYNMTGWRIGFIAGNQTLVKAFSIVKSHMDSGQFIPIQKAAALALNHPEWIERVLEKYKRRLFKLYRILIKKGFPIANFPKAGVFIYTPIPKKISNQEFDTAQEVAEYLVREKSILTVPWDEESASLRFSVTFEADTLDKENYFFDSLEKRLSDLKFIF